MPNITDRLSGVSEGVAYKAPVRVATTANITLSGLQTIDGVTLAAGDRVLVRAQNDATQNGVYSASTGLWRRTKDFDGNNDLVQGTQVLVTGGNSGEQAYFVSAANPINVGTTAITFATTLSGLSTISLVVGTLTAALGLISISPLGGQATLQLGTPSVAAAPFIDFHASASNAGYGVRLFGTDSGSVSGGGSLGLLGSLQIAPVAGTLQQGLSITQSGPTTGSHGTGPYNFNSITISGDQTNLSLGNSSVSGLNVTLSTGGSNAGGTRVGIWAEVDLVGASNGLQLRDHIAMACVAKGFSGDGGTNTGAGARGTLFGMNPGVFAFSGATNLFEIAGAELDVGIFTGASSRYRFGLSTVGIGDITAASLDAAYEVGAGSVGCGWKTGFLAANIHGASPFQTTATVFGTDGSANTVGSVLDFSSYTISDYFIRSSNAWITGAGVIRGTSSITIAPFGGQAALQLGTPSVATTPFIDFYASASNAGYGVRLYGSDAGSVAGGGTLNLLGSFLLTGNIQALAGTAIPAGGTAGAGITLFSTPNFGVFGGSGAPTLSAAKGSIYLRSDGSTTNDRAYINTNGANAWTALTTAA